MKMLQENLELFNAEFLNDEGKRAPLPPAQFF